VAQSVGVIPGVWKRALYVFLVWCASARSSAAGNQWQVVANGPRYGARGGRLRMVQAGVLFGALPTPGAPLMFSGAWTMLEG